MSDMLVVIEDCLVQYPINNPPREYTTWLVAEVKRLQELLDEVKSYGHWDNCPAGVSGKYRCRCAYGLIAEQLS